MRRFIKDIITLGIAYFCFWMAFPDLSWPNRMFIMAGIIFVTIAVKED